MSGDDPKEERVRRELSKIEQQQERLRQRERRTRKKLQQIEDAKAMAVGRVLVREYGIEDEATVRAVMATAGQRQTKEAEYGKEKTDGK